MRINKSKKDMFKVCYEFSPITFQEYSRKINRITRAQIRRTYQQVFHRECDDKDLVWAKYAIQYELSRQQYIKDGDMSKLEPGSQFRNAYMAVRRKDLKAVNENMKTLIAYDTRHLSELATKEKSMEKANAAKKSKCIGITTGLTVYEAWVHCFKKNAKEHKNDEEITKFLLSEFPDHQIKSFYAVHACRNYYNNGRFTGGVKPEVKSVRYVDGVEYKRAKKDDGTKSAKPTKVSVPATPEAPAKAAKPAVIKKKVVVRKTLAKRK